MDAVAVDRAGTESRDAGAPHRVRAADERDARDLATGVAGVEHAQLDRVRMLGEKRERHAGPIAVRAEVRRVAGPRHDAARSIIEAR